MPNRSEPTAALERLEFIDSLRGFALFGVFWANLLIFSGIGFMNDEQRSALFQGSIDSLAYFLERFLIENKFMGLFSFLFGISFWLFISRAQARAKGGTALFYRRIGWLFVIGLVHGWLLWCFDVLRFYALWAVLLPLFARVPLKRLFVIALAACLLVPAFISAAQVWIPKPVGPTTDFDAMALAAFSRGSYSEVLIANLKYDGYLTLSLGQVAYQIAVFGRLLLGLFVARALDFAKLDEHHSLLRAVLIVAAAVGLLGSTIVSAKLLDAVTDNAPLLFFRRLLVESGQLGLTLAYAAGLALLFIKRWGRSSVSIFAPVGRMALTWYLVQTVFGVWMFYGFPNGPSLMGKVSPAHIVGLALIGFALQLALARAWLSKFRFGPVEWLWRTLTYWKVQPLRVASPTMS